MKNKCPSTSECRRKGNTESTRYSEDINMFFYVCIDIFLKNNNSCRCPKRKSKTRIIKQGKWLKKEQNPPNKKKQRKAMYFVFSTNAHIRNDTHDNCPNYRRVPSNKHPIEDNKTKNYAVFYILMNGDKLYKKTYNHHDKSNI